jgi:hypothetical protein
MPQCSVLDPTRRGRGSQDYCIHSASKFWQARVEAADDLPMFYELYDVNEIWISQAGRMWDNVLHEIVAQEVQIDLKERSDAMAAVEVLSLFDRCAGPLYAEAGERYTTIPDGVWADMGAKIDRAGTSLEETLEPEGKKVLRDLARHRRGPGDFTSKAGE